MVCGQRKVGGGERQGGVWRSEVGTWESIRKYVHDSSAPSWVYFEGLQSRNSEIITRERSASFL